MPLERLLEEGVPDDEAMDTSSFALTPDQEIAELKRRLQVQQERLTISIKPSGSFVMTTRPYHITVNYDFSTHALYKTQHIYF